MPDKPPPTHGARSSVSGKDSPVLSFRPLPSRGSTTNRWSCTSRTGGRLARSSAVCTPALRSALYSSPAKIEHSPADSNGSFTG